METRYCVLYNPLAGTRNGAESAKKLSGILGGHEIRYVDITAVTDYQIFFDSLSAGEEIIVAGGEGTLNRFANEAERFLDGRKILYYPTGTGNDFLRDIGQTDSEAPVEISAYLRNLPSVTVNGITRKFLNGIGYGIDGYCSETGERLREKSSRPINYTAIAIKGMLFSYKSTSAEVTVDGETRFFKNVWLAPCMYGRFFGGGMMPTPNQRRGEKKLSCLVWCGRSRLMTLALFPKIFSGEHVRHVRSIHIMEGRSITVKFNRPVALQIDGEVVTNVSSYSTQI